MSPGMSSSIVEQVVPRINVSPSMITWHKMNIEFGCRTDVGQRKFQCVWEALIANVDINKDFIFDFYLPQSFLQDACLAVGLQTNWLFKFERNCGAALMRKWRTKICCRKLLSKTIGKSACYGSNLNLISSLDAKISGCRHFARKITHQACQTFPELGCQLFAFCEWPEEEVAQPRASWLVYAINLMW